MDIRTVLADLPIEVKAFTVSSNDDYYTIVLNQNLSSEQNQLSYWHELRHIIKGDFDKHGSADLIEVNAHK